MVPCSVIAPAVQYLLSFREMKLISKGQIASHPQELCRVFFSRLSGWQSCCYSSALFWGEYKESVIDIDFLLQDLRDINNFASNPGPHCCLRGEPETRKAVAV